jgi:hypothetical protein
VSPPGETVDPGCGGIVRGRALSFMSQGPAAIIRLVGQKQATIISPLQGRTDGRPWAPASLIPFHILGASPITVQSFANPMVSLPPWWHEEIAPCLSAGTNRCLQQLAEQLGVDAAAGGYRVSQHRIEQQLTYLSIKADGDGDALACVRKRLEAEGLPPTVAFAP